MIDLHMHSTFSDGSLTPEELADAGRRAGLRAMALTDHDCTDGVPRFVAACDGHGIRGIAGVEISAEVGKGTLHMLGYHVEPGHPSLESALRPIREGRGDRNQIILQTLNRLGLALTWDEVKQHAGEDIVGRPHFAMAMIARGYVTSKEEAFDRFLAKGKPAYAERFRLSPQDSMKSIAAAGGVPVLAHPFTLGLGRKALRASVGELKEQGLQGIEVWYSEHTQEQTAQYLNLAREFNLVATGGSDFHGAMNPDVRLGVGFGSLDVSDDVADALEQRRPGKAVNP